MSTRNITNRHMPQKLQSNIMQNTGGQPVIERILKAYGFTTRQSLCNHLGISQSTMANRYARNTFPSDWTIICSIETGASLQWLISGEGAMYQDEVEHQALSLKHYKITDGVLSSHNDIYYDGSLLPSGLSNPSLVANENSLYLIDEHEGEINDGWWVIEIDGLYSIREVFRFPGGRIRVENGKASFECQAQDIKVFGKVILKTEQLI
ncbi:phage repressor protein [Enterobacter cloacae]|nr:phage repressor protein [Enterobacter cloacae]HCR0683651.1 phage repressor protein CI [Klebsiella aerogenes]